MRGLVAAAALALLLLPFSGCRMTMIKNVFDEIYYSEPKAATILGLSTSFYNVEPFQKRSIADAPENLVGLKYNKNYLEKDEAIHIEIDTADKTIAVTFTKKPAEEASFQVVFKYYVDDKVLEYCSLNVNTPEEAYTRDPKKAREFMERYGITDADIEEYRRWLVYDRIIADWCEGNGAASAFTPQSPGEFTVKYA
jgi:hypothetical protein